MRRVCGWCKDDLDPELVHEADVPVTHGICSSCALKITTGTSRSAREMLDLVDEPVFLLGEDGVLHAVNRSGCRLVGKDADSIADQLLGDVFECVNAGLPGGCGASIHCSMCTMRTTLLETLKTGKGTSSLPATKNINAPDGEREVHFLISTEKVDGKILMRIEAVEPAEQASN